MIDGFLDDLAGIDTIWLAVIAFFLPFGETVAFLDFLVPGEVGMVLVGVAARTPGRVAVAITFGMLGAFCGDSVSWYIGHRWGTAVLSKWPWLWHRMEPQLAHATAHFERHGGKSIFAARFVGALRAIAPLVAGTAGLSYRRFAPWNAAASVCWVSLIVILGAVFGSNIESIVDRLATIISIVGVSVVVAWFVQRRRHHRVDSTGR
jgi:undecaprenyl-diphosphatase